MILRCPKGHELSSPNWCPTCKRTPFGRGERGTIADVRELRRHVREIAMKMTEDGVKLP